MILSCSIGSPVFFALFAHLRSLTALSLITGRLGEGQIEILAAKGAPDWSRIKKVDFSASQETPSFAD